MQQVDAGGMGEVVGVSPVSTNNTFCVTSIDASGYYQSGFLNWVLLPSSLIYISCGPVFGCWGTDSANRIYVNQVGHPRHRLPSNQMAHCLLSTLESHADQLRSRWLGAGGRGGQHGGSWDRRQRLCFERAGQRLPEVKLSNMDPAKKPVPLTRGLVPHQNRHLRRRSARHRLDPNPHVHDDHTLDLRPRAAVVNLRHGSDPEVHAVAPRPSPWRRQGSSFRSTDGLIHAKITA